MVPNEKMLIETDSPYLSPEPLRGKRNDCRNVKYVAQKIAEVKQLPVEEIANITYQNANKICLEIIKKYNVLATRRLPQFDRSGGDDHA